MSISRASALGEPGGGIARRRLRRLWSPPPRPRPRLRALSPARHHSRPGTRAGAQVHSNKWPLRAGPAVSSGVRRYPVSPSWKVPLSPAAVVTPPLSRPALRLRGKMAAEKQVPGGGGSGSGGGSGGGGGGGRGAGGEENKENERPSAGSKANKEFGDSLSLESIRE